MSTPQESFDNVEALTGLRFPWNSFPSSRTQAAQLPVPLSCTFTPLKHIENLKCVEMDPPSCSKCQAYANPYCDVAKEDLRFWNCAICGTVNQTPPHIMQNPIPFMQDSVAIEYKIGEARESPFYFFVVDAFQSKATLDALKDVLVDAIPYIPENAYIGIMSYSTTLQIWDLEAGDIPRSYTFNAEAVPNDEKLKELFTGYNSPFLKTIGDCAFSLEATIRAINKAAWPVQDGQRPRRATGSALLLAQRVLKVVANQRPGRVMLFSSGPITYGEGKFAELEKTKVIRTHHSLENELVSGSKSSKKFFAKLTEKFCEQYITVDVWAGSVRQAGIYEMETLVRKTGGYCFMTDRFSDDIFRSSFLKTFAAVGGIGARALYGDADAPLEDTVTVGSAFQVTLQACATPMVRFCGAIGNCYSLKVQSPSVSHKEIGESGTCMWQMCSCDANNSLAFFFDVNEVEGPTPDRAVIQFVMTYTHPLGHFVRRVVTLAVGINATAQTQNFINAFDQEAAAVIVARVCVEKQKTDDQESLVRLIDKTLINMGIKFGQYQMNAPSSFHFPLNMGALSQFLFYLRKSVLLSKFNETPDETVFKANVFNRSNVYNSLQIFQPLLMMYSDKGVRPVLLDTSSMGPNRILFLDTYHTLLVHYDEMYKRWSEEGYQNVEGYSWFAALIDEANGEVHRILAERWPTPVVHLVYPGHSQERFLKSLLNNADTPQGTSNSSVFSGTKRIVRTEDASFSAYTSNLATAVVLNNTK
ncbi:hypothetical protein PCE1_001179 [Barthelona sp. PCE]